LRLLAVGLFSRNYRPPPYLHVQSSQGFCARYLWPWLGPALAALRYVICFRFYGRRYVCTWPGIGDAKRRILSVIQQGAARIRCRGLARSDGPGAESAIYDCLVWSDFPFSVRSICIVLTGSNAVENPFVCSSLTCILSLGQFVFR